MGKQKTEGQGMDKWTRERVSFWRAKGGEYWARLRAREVVTAIKADISLGADPTVGLEVIGTLRAEGLLNAA